MKHSLRLRVLMASGLILLISVALIVFSVMKSFERAQYDLIKKELAAGANVLLTVASVTDQQLVMPHLMPDERFNQVESEVLGLVLDKQGDVLWRSHSSLDEILYYSVQFDEHTTNFARYSGPEGSYFLYDIDILLEGLPLTFLTMIPATEYKEVFIAFRSNLLLSLSLTALLMMVVLWYGMHWSLIPIRKLAGNLQRIEAGDTNRLEGVYSSELVALTDALNQLLNNERQQRERYRDAMADLAHSLKTPLAVLQSAQYSQTLKNHGENENVGAVIDEQVHRMNQIISYQLQRALTRQRGLVRHRADVADIVGRITRTLDKVYHDKRVELNTDIDAGIHFPAEEQDMMEVLGNLLENAYRLCLHQVQVSSHTLLQDGKSWTVCQIEDDGAGVPESRRQAILKRGVRADSRTKGQGIGLAVAMDIIDSYDGSLSISDSELGGASFTIRLPL
ncbi:hypothetical protein GZ77_18515 [Endozoicomonas montiporae]|uniref:histidine kinase n=2 Tax=Endozoicomonas montiporae TaxID=1027273 RepID=A0A081N237_9GAMM|nr:ATP-binding protein [Endozoicomonas montiporae]AMO58535.1 protein PhoQ [Endozoicomonas montiporae CL-33]KEQ12510.1 hypothetical protein GZ77_18515 [Endozoicomonas montiporae]